MRGAPTSTRLLAQWTHPDGLQGSSSVPPCTLAGMGDSARNPLRHPGRPRFVSGFPTGVLRARAWGPLVACVAILGGCGDGVVDRVGRIWIEVRVDVIDATTELPVEGAGVFVGRSRRSVQSAELRELGQSDAEAGWSDISEVKFGTTDARGRATLRWMQMMSWSPDPPVAPAIEVAGRSFYMLVRAEGYAEAHSDSANASWSIVRRAADAPHKTIEYSGIVARVAPAK